MLKNNGIQKNKNDIIKIIDISNELTKKYFFVQMLNIFLYQNNDDF